MCLNLLDTESYGQYRPNYKNHNTVAKELILEFCTQNLLLTKLLVIILNIKLKIFAAWTLSSNADCNAIWHTISPKADAKNNSNQRSYVHLLDYIKASPKMTVPKNSCIKYNVGHRKAGHCFVLSLLRCLMLK